MKGLDKIKKESEKVIYVNSIDNIPATNMLKQIASARLVMDGYYSATIGGVKTLFILIK